MPSRKLILHQDKVRVISERGITCALQALKDKAQCLEEIEDTEYKQHEVKEDDLPRWQLAGHVK